MNTLLFHEAIYTQEEFQDLFAEWASKRGKIPIDKIRKESGVSD
jgi:hypothetical protein